MAEYTTKQVVEKTKVSKSTLIRWEEQGVFPKPMRRVSTNARIWTDEHIQKIVEYRYKVKEPPSEAPPSRGRKK